MKIATTLIAPAALMLAVSGATGQVDLAVNGGFEAGDTSGWEYFPTGVSSFGVSTDAFEGNFAGQLVNTASGSAAIIKQANLGVGFVTPGSPVNISFWAKGSAEAGGVQFAEFFTELAGGGTSSSQILGGAPLFVTSEYQFYNFDVLVGPDASGGITLQLTATTGANIGSTSTLIVDNVVINAVPAPAGVAALGLAGLIATRRRRA
jgi:hypothetical protein